MSVPKTKKYFFLAISLLLASVFSVLGMGYMIHKNGLQLKEDMSAIALKENLKKERLALRTIHNDTEADRAQLESYVLDGQDGVVALLSLLDSIAAEQGVVLDTKRLDYHEPTEDALFGEMKIQMSITGPEQSAMRMLQMIENIPYHRTLQTLSSVRGTDPNQGRIMTHNINYTVSSKAQ